MNYISHKTLSFNGEILAPPSKSHTLRAILFASMAKGQSVIENYLKSPDTLAMVSACRQFGAKIEIENDQLLVLGVNGSTRFKKDAVVDVGNSGQVLRFIPAMAALQSNDITLTGDKSIQCNRPMQPLIDGLNQLGASCISTKNDCCAPIVLKGTVKPGVVEISGEDSQPVSALLMACSFLNKQTEIEVKNPGEKSWIDLTLSWLDKFGIPYKNENYSKYIVGTGKDQRLQIKGFNYVVPGDFSSLLFPIVAALITKSEIKIKYVDMNDAQGDKKVIDVFIQMGANIEYHDQTLVIKKTDKLIGRKIVVNDFIDAVPILAVVGCYAEGETIITEGEIARKKECDRISAIYTELKKMGANIEEQSDGLIIKQSKLYGTTVETYHDHRMVMSLAIAGLIADGETIVEDIQSVSKSYPIFLEDMKNLGANILVTSIWSYKNEYYFIWL